MPAPHRPGWTPRGPKASTRSKRPCRSLPRSAPTCPAPPVSPMAPNRDYEGKVAALCLWLSSVMFIDRDTHLAYEAHPDHVRAGGMISSRALHRWPRGNIRRRSGGLILATRPRFAVMLRQNRAGKDLMADTHIFFVADGARLELQSWLLAASLAQAHDGAGGRAALRLCQPGMAAADRHGDEKIHLPQGRRRSARPAAGCPTGRNPIRMATRSSRRPTRAAPAGRSFSTPTWSA